MIRIRKWVFSLVYPCGRVSVECVACKFVRSVWRDCEQKFTQEAKIYQNSVFGSAHMPIEVESWIFQPAINDRSMRHEFGSYVSIQQLPLHLLRLFEQWEIENQARAIGGFRSRSFANVSFIFFIMGHVHHHHLLRSSRARQHCCKFLYISLSFVPLPSNSFRRWSMEILFMNFAQTI